MLYIYYINISSIYSIYCISIINIIFYILYNTLLILDILIRHFMAAELVGGIHQTLWTCHLLCVCVCNLRPLWVGPACHKVQFIARLQESYCLFEWTPLYEPLHYPTCVPRSCRSAPKKESLPICCMRRWKYSQLWLP